MFYNAVYDVSLLTIPHSATELNHEMQAVSDNKALLTNYMNSTIKQFHPDNELAAARIAQFNQEYKELKEMSEKINEVSFLTVITRSNKQINAYIKRKRELEKETIDVSDFLNVAYYKFSQVNGTLKQFREGFSRFLENK